MGRKMLVQDRRTRRLYMIEVPTRRRMGTNILMIGLLVLVLLIGSAFAASAFKGFGSGSNGSSSSNDSSLSISSGTPPAGYQGADWGSNSVDESYVKQVVSNYLSRISSGAASEYAGSMSDLLNSIPDSFQIAQQYGMDVAYLWGDCLVETHCGYDEDGSGLGIKNLWGLGCYSPFQSDCLNHDKSIFSSWDDAYRSWFKTVKGYGLDGWIPSLNHYNGHDTYYDGVNRFVGELQQKTCCY